MGPIAWTRPELDLDTLDEAAIAALIARDRPEVVVHAAAWTDVDGCAREPDLALPPQRRRGRARSREPARRAGVELVAVSTNEVFDGTRTDGTWLSRGRRAVAGQPVRRLEARTASSGHGPRSRTPPARGSRSSGRAGSTARPGNDFPEKIARRGAPGPGRRASRCASSATRSARPTYARDVADAIVELLAEDAITEQPARHAIHHLVNGGRATRADWAREVLRAPGIDVPIEEVPASHLAAGVDAAAVGRPGAHAAPVGRADAPLAGRLRRRRARRSAARSRRADRTGAAHDPVPPRTGRVTRRTAPDRTPRHRTRAAAGPKGPAAS